MNVYFIPGLGVDEKAFQNIHLPEPFQIKHIQWIEPLPNEELSSYSSRLISQIDQSKPFIIVGLSFGGLLAVEISCILPASKTILLSSIANSNQLPWYYKLANRLRLHKILPLGVLQKANRFLYWAFGTKTKQQKDFFKSINLAPNVAFTKWAIDKILNWPRRTNPFKVIQIHGTRDRIFPVRYVQADCKIKNGSHFMIFNDSETVSEKLAEILMSQ